MGPECTTHKLNAELRCYGRYSPMVQNTPMALWVMPLYNKHCDNQGIQVNGV